MKPFLLLIWSLGVFVLVAACEGEAAPTLPLTAAPSATPTSTAAPTPTPTATPTTTPTPPPTPTPIPPSFQVEEGTIRAYARDLNIDWGTVAEFWIQSASYGSAWDDTAYKEVISKQFNILVTNNTNMVNVAPSEGRWEFSYADDVVEFAESNDMKLRFHPLIMGTDPREGKTIGEDWHPTPDWILNGDFNREDMINILYEYLETVMNRYGDRIDEWVVVNEPIWLGSDGNSGHQTFQAASNPA